MENRKPSSGHTSNIEITLFEAKSCRSHKFETLSAIILHRENAFKLAASDRVSAISKQAQILTFAEQLFLRPFPLSFVHAPFEIDCVSLLRLPESRDEFVGLNGVKRHSRGGTKRKVRGVCTETERMLKATTCAPMPGTYVNSVNRRNVTQGNINGKNLSGFCVLLISAEAAGLGLSALICRFISSRIARSAEPLAHAAGTLRVQDLALGNPWFLYNGCSESYSSRLREQRL